MGLWRAVVDLFFPTRCVGCGRVDHLLCPDCFRTIEWLDSTLCPLCGAPVDLEFPAKARYSCPHCRANQLYLDGILCVAAFQGVIRQAIHALKYQGRTEVAAPLAELMVPIWGDRLFPVEFLVPVPLHPRRLRERGYNQAALIAEGLASGIGLPVLSSVITRSRMTKPQTQLRAHQRQANVAGAFVADSVIATGKSLMLVDDVYTTGSTLQACADALRAAGAKKVCAFTVARATWDRHSGKTSDVSDS